MNACISRIFGCFIGLAVGCLLCNVPLGFAVGLWCSIFLILLYIFIRPLMQLIILPFNIFLLGSLTLLSDALLVRLAAALTPGLSLTYWQALLISTLIAICYIPYGHQRRKMLMRG